MRDESLFYRLTLGAAAGLAGTFALMGLRMASQKWLPETMPPMRQEPGEFIVEQAEAALPQGASEQIPATVEQGAAMSLALGYGMTAGALYAAFRPEGGNPLVDGATLGLGTWAVGYLGWIPALGLMPPVSEQKAGQAIAPPIRHALFGLATVAAYGRLRDAFSWR